MAKPASLLEDAKAFARDFARDRMPPGYMWDLVDYVPNLLDAQLTGRGPWKWASAVAGGDIESGVYAAFKAGDKLLIVDSTGQMHDVDQTTGALTPAATVHRSRQNPAQFMDFVIVPDRDGAAAAKAVGWNGTAYSNVNLHASAPTGRYVGVYKSRIMLANAAGKEGTLAMSPAGLIDGANAANTGKPDLCPWDPYSMFQTSLPLSGIGALRAVILLFHTGSVERIRGGIPPTAADPLGDMIQEPLFERAGCGDARSIAYWQDNCIFADERGVHMTDGAIVRNLASQGGILGFWRTLYRDKATIAADTFLDYYVVTVIRTTGEAVTLVCDLQRRTWIRFNNIRALTYIHSIGAQEQLWGGRQGAQRLVSLSNCFFPVPGQMIDDDGAVILPSFETPWYRLAEEGRKRVRFVYLSYDVRTSSAEVAAQWRGLPDSEDQVLEPWVAPAINGSVQAVLAQALELGYITSPHQANYEIAGRLPETTKYTRYRLPIGKNPYGIAFRVKQLIPSYVTRVYDLAAQAQPDERSRV